MSTEKTRVCCNNCSKRFFLFKDNPCPYCKTSYQIKKGRKIVHDAYDDLIISE